MSSTNHNIVESSHEVESWDLLYDMSKQGLGSALIPDFIIKPEDKMIQINKKLKLPKIEYSIVAFYNKQRQLSFIADLFLSHLI